MANHTDKRETGYKKIIIILLLIICICGIILFVKIKLDEHRENEMQREVSKVIETIDVPKENVTPVVTERMLKVKELKQENNDIVGWLEIDGTNINYPVLQGEDNEYYLKHNFKGEYISTGSIFLDKDYDFSKPSSNLLVYGHRNKVGLMFDELIKYKDEDFYKEHKKIRFTTADEDVEYEIMSAFKSRVYYKDEENVFRYYYFVDAQNKEEYDEYVTNSKEVSLYDTGVTAEYGEQLLTLSTCDYEVTNGRFVVVAVKVNNLKND